MHQDHHGCVAVGHRRDGTITAFHVDGVTRADIQELGVEVGKSKSQATLETLALAVAMREWLPGWVGQKTVVVLRSDSVVALGAVVSGDSGKPVINKVVREVALDAASSRYGIDFAVLLPGADNTIADVLSRLSEPGRIYEVPGVHRHIRQSILPDGPKNGGRRRGSRWAGRSRRGMSRSPQGSRAGQEAT